ncbi:MAG: hypothetical protein RIN55_09750 [Tissierellaceae bacterium]|nr:hypothetical protein [Tissierellaceae bacterium]
MFRRFKYFVLLVLSISIMFSLMACNNSNEQGKDTINPSEIKDKVKDKVDSLLSKEDQDLVMNKYYKLLTENKTIDDISNFVDENIEGLDKENIETMIVSLGDYLSNTDSSVYEDYSLLNQYKDYVSDEMKSYLSLIERETSNLFTDGEELNVDISEVINRAIEAEKHLEKFPKGKIYNKIYDLYSGYIKGAILGAGNPYIFAEDGSTIIREEYIDKYKSITEDNKDSRTAEILSQYVNLLEKENRDLNSNQVNEFYDKLDILIEDSFLK